MIGVTPARVGPHLKLNRSATVSHRTPDGDAQEFLYAQFKRI